MNYKSHRFLISVNPNNYLNIPTSLSLIPHIPAGCQIFIVLFDFITVAMKSKRVIATTALVCALTQLILPDGLPCSHSFVRLLFIIITDCFDSRYAQAKALRRDHSNENFRGN
ncbi:hypothetical protein I3842_15G119900 [Carya illinoinensis]|uniref:Uncharacterized protein n=1 Tax=Carya illinoinensis TaxID=32201 RepID=A0A922AFI9_CARIL|nr:hypothetical protein I3842_15G119900 [Carya illinoinensis]